MTALGHPRPKIVSEDPAKRTTTAGGGPAKGDNDEDEFDDDDGDPEGYEAVLNVIRGYEDRMRALQDQSELDSSEDDLSPTTLGTTRSLPSVSCSSGGNTNSNNAPSSTNFAAEKPSSGLTSTGNANFSAQTSSNSTSSSSSPFTSPTNPSSSAGGPGFSQYQPHPPTSSSIRTGSRRDSSSSGGSGGASTRRNSGDKPISTNAHHQRSNSTGDTTNSNDGGAGSQKYRPFLPTIDRSGGRRRTSGGSTQFAPPLNNNSNPNSSGGEAIPPRKAQSLLSAYRQASQPSQYPAEDYSKLTYEELQQKHKTILARIEELQEERMCVICTEQFRAMLLIPCGHLCVCDKCARPLASCPLCRQPIRRTIKTQL